MLYRSFNLDKTIQAISFLARNGEENYMKLIKLLYFAERYHLRHYGDLIVYDNYTALKFGPIQSKTKDLITKNEFYFNNVLDDPTRDKFTNLIEKKEYNIIIHDNNKDLLSESEIESLEFAIERFGEFNQFILKDISHDYPEWKKFESIFLENPNTSEQMSITDFFDNPSRDSSFIITYLKKDPFADIDLEQLKYFKNNYLRHHNYLTPV